jgi:hypothetical protein
VIGLRILDMVAEMEYYTRKYKAAKSCIIVWEFLCLLLVIIDILSLYNAVPLGVNLERCIHSPAYYKLDCGHGTRDAASEILQ